MEGKKWNPNSIHGEGRRDEGRGEECEKELENCAQLQCFVKTVVNMHSTYGPRKKQEKKRPDTQAGLKPSLHTRPESLLLALHSLHRALLGTQWGLAHSRKGGREGVRPSFHARL